MQDDLVALARDSAELNRFDSRVLFVTGDLLAPPAALHERRFDHVMANPPFTKSGTGRVSPDASRALASVEGAADLAAWIAFCVAHAAPGGSVTFIHRADRAGEVASFFAGAGLTTLVFPLGPKRVLVQGHKTGRGSVAYLTGLALHQADGRFAPDADAILRHGAALTLAK